MDRKEAVTILQEKRDLARMLEAAEKSADWAAKDRVDSSSLRASQHGRYADALDMAISALSPPNEPLTIEQLRERDGEPVWIANPDALEYGRWGIVDGVYQAEDDQVLMLRGDYSCHYYGKTWLAYRRPSEGEENAQ